MTHTEQLDRIEGIVPACITPFAEGEDYPVNYDMVPVLVDRFADAGVGGIFANGTSGEFLALTVEERENLAETYVAAADGRMPVIVHVGARSLEDAVRLAQHAESIGADAIATLPPIDREQSTVDDDFAWYRAVGASSRLPLGVYLRSDMGSSEIRPKEFLARAEDIPTLGFVKYGAPNMHIPEGIKRLRPDIKILTGPDELLLGGLVHGSDGAIGTTYNAFPEHAVDIYRSHRARNPQRAEELQGQLGEVIEALIEEGVVLAGIKAVMRGQGLDVGQCRPSDRFGRTLAAHTESTFVDRVTPRQEARFNELADRYGML